MMLEFSLLRLADIGWLVHIVIMESQFVSITSLWMTVKAGRGDNAEGRDTCGSLSAGNQKGNGGGIGRIDYCIHPPNVTIPLFYLFDLHQL